MGDSSQIVDSKDDFLRKGTLQPLSCPNLFPKGARRGMDEVIGTMLQNLT